MPVSLVASTLVSSLEGSSITVPRASADQRGTGTIRVAIAHGQQLVRAGLRVLLEDREPAALMRAVRLLGRGGRLRPQRPRRTHPAREVPMLTPKVTEITRGCAHADKSSQVKTGSRRAS
jgi:hypothetical protein